MYKLVTEDLQMRKVCAKLVPKVLTGDQKARRLAVCKEMFQRLQNDLNFLNEMVTGDDLGLRLRS